MATLIGDWEPVIGLEVHAQLLTHTKAFCACATSFGDPPNEHTCPVCLGLPGSLPALNREAVRMATVAALTLGCTVQRESVFSRKNYFYPDLPKGYQISQYDLPLALRGALEIESPSRGKVTIGITRVHMEEDAGKNLHGVGAESVVDLNRAGTPLIEIVGEPDLRSSAEAGEYLRRLRELLLFLGVNDGNLEQGSFRADANVSVRKKGAPKYGTRTELKNINSFRFVEEAIEVEIRRQIALIEAGQTVRQQTRGYNSDKRETFLLRDKENESGYRYFPEPDLPPLVVDEAFVATVLGSLPETPAQKRARYVETLGLTAYAAGVLTGHPEIARFFEEAAAAHGDAVKVGNFVQSEVLRDVRTTGLTATFPATAAHVAALLRLVDEGTISGKQAKDVYAAMIAGPLAGRAPAEIVKEKGLAVMSDAGALEQMARLLIEQNPKQAAGYRAGKTTLLGFFVGQMMKATSGSADPALVNDVLKRLLGGEAATAPTQEKTPIQESAPAEAKPAEAKPAEAKAESEAKPATALVTYDDFAKLDLRVGLVVSASRVPRKDKLLDLRIDTGDDGGPRRIVAGLALSFAPEELVGKRVVVICNLEPRAFSKDLVSHGMILAAGTSDALGLTTVTRDVPPGTRVK